jgi:hypothetical protein
VISLDYHSKKGQKEEHQEERNSTIIWCYQSKAG